MLTTNDIKIDYVFLGSSRVDNHIDTEIIELQTGRTAINLGIQGAKLEDSYHLLQLMLERKIRPEIIFIQVDYNYNLEGESEYLTSYLMPYINNSVVHKIIKERHPDYFYLKNIPFYRYMKYDFRIGFREAFNASIGNKPSIDLSKGYSPIKLHSNNTLKTSLPSKIAEENIAIKRIDSLALQSNLKIIYFTAPLCTNTLNLSYLEKLKLQLPNLWDYSKHFPQNHYYYNCTHLNDLGAKEFSEILGGDIKSIQSPI
ncbi:hypothetical protein ACW6QP_09620 [Salegentibacter sp. HM20]